MKKLLLDMDGVIVDFIRGVIEYHKLDIAYEDVLLDISKQSRMDPRDFYEPLSEEFWTSLKWTPDGGKILSGILDFVDVSQICLCTAPLMTKGCAQGKINWIEQNLPVFRRQYLIGTAKQFAASPTTLLVDDSPRNCSEFAEAGGAYFLYPRPWNAGKGDKDVATTVGAIRSLWEAI